VYVCVCVCIYIYIYIYIVICYESAGRVRLRSGLESPSQAAQLPVTWNLAIVELSVGQGLGSRGGIEGWDRGVGSRGGIEGLNIARRAAPLP
jgi:hypothetical protein